MKERGVKCCIQVLDMSKGKPRHVAKITALIDPEVILHLLRTKIPKMLVVSKPARPKKGALVVAGDQVEEKKGGKPHE